MTHSSFPRSPIRPEARLLGSFLISSAVVLAGLALVRHGAAPPPADPPPPPALPAASSVAPLAPAPSPVIELPALRIVASLARPRQTPRPAPHAPELVPCSDWRAIGPVFSVHEGEVPRERHVRLMCPPRR